MAEHATAFSVTSPLVSTTSSTGVLLCGRTPTTFITGGKSCVPVLRNVGNVGSAGSATITTITMKRSRFNAPSRQPQGQRPGELKVPEDGTPIFAIFVRTPTAKIWYPLGSVKGDDRSKQMVGALKNALGRALYENALDKGIAQTVYGQGKQRFVGSAVRLYPQLKRATKVLEFGYKVSAQGLEAQKIKLVTEEMALPAFEWAKRKLGSVFSAPKKGE